MIIDKSLELADAVALNTGAAGTYLIGSQIDLTKARDIGNGQPLYLVISVDTAVTSSGSATVQFKLSSDSSASVATDGSATDHVISPVYPKADLVAGFTAVFPLPLEGLAYEEFLGLLQTTATAAVTAGKINAFITSDPHGNKAYPDATN